MGYEGKNDPSARHDFRRPGDLTLIVALRLWCYPRAQACVWVPSHVPRSWRHVVAAGSLDGNSSCLPTSQGFGDPRLWEWSLIYSHCTARDFQLVGLF
jgi:hypothetical protein